MTENTADEIRKLMMLISNLRSKDNERYEEHVSFMNEVISFMKKISDNMNENWKKISSSLSKLNTTIEDSLNLLLTGINPDSLKETSTSLKEIMETMEKSMQSINLENVMRELQLLTGNIASSGKIIPSIQTDAEAISSEFGSPYATSDSKEPEIYGFVPDHMKKKNKKKKKDKELHLLKPSDLFKK
ncbi:MAG: hypothetical protein ACTSWY_13560 [Promethearchaeota archaeon]